MIDSETFRLIAQAASTAVAFVAIYLSFRSERRNQIRFQEQLDLSRRIAEANIRPLLSLTAKTYVDRKGLELENLGTGTAVITKLTFQRGKHIASDILDVLDLEVDVEWDDFTSSISNIPSKTSENLVELSEEKLLEQGISKSKAAALLEKLAGQIDEIKLTVTYEDVLGNVIARNDEIYVSPD
jgi:hypothetical protein